MITGSRELDVYVKIQLSRSSLVQIEENIWTKEGWSDGRVEKAA
jgi:hypothetical protein